MEDQRNGRRFAVPRSRRLSWDLLYFSRQIPLCGHDRRMNLRTVAGSRRSCRIRISWPAIFLKAYGLTAVRFPQLRQTWYCWPWAHLYQNPVSVGMLTIQRCVDDEPWLFWGRFNEPENRSLADIQRVLDGYCTQPVHLIFSRQWQLARVPTALRRMIWWWNIHIAAGARAKRLGTFFLSTLAGRGAEIQIPPAIQTGCLTFGPLDEQGCCRVTLAYDHRVMDGALVADILLDLEATLNSVIAEELAALLVPTEPASGADS